MNNRVRNTIAVIVIILLIFAILFAVYTHFKTEPMNANTQLGNNIPDANTGLENMLNQILNEEENTTVEQNKEQNTNKNENKEPNSNPEDNNKKDNEDDSLEDDNRMTPKESKAINLVKEYWKKEWGNIEDVAFNVSIQSDGKYGVTVYDVTTTQSIQFYIVDVDKETVKER